MNRFAQGPAKERERERGRESSFKPLSFESQPQASQLKELAWQAVERLAVLEYLFSVRLGFDLDPKPLHWKASSV